MQIELSTKINQLIVLLAKGSQTSFAKQIGVSQPTLNRNLKAQANDKLMDITGRILAAFPEVRREWLLHDEGEMLATDQTPRMENPIHFDLQAELEKSRKELHDVYAAHAQTLKELVEARKEITRLYQERVSPMPTRGGDFPAEEELRESGDSVYGTRALQEEKAVYVTKK